MINDTILPFSFPAVHAKKITAAFDGGRLTSNGGALGERYYRIVSLFIAAGIDPCAYRYAAGGMRCTGNGRSFGPVFQRCMALLPQPFWTLLTGEKTGFR
jgi:hypothetical protein